MHDARALVHAVAGADQGFLVLIHEFGPALGHDDDMELRLMTVPAGAFFGRFIGPDYLSDDLAGCGVGDAEVAVNEEIPQPIRAEFGISGFDM